MHLNLQKNTHPNSDTLPGLPTISLGSFRVASQRMHNAVMAEFGGSLAVDGNAEAEASMEADPNMSRMIGNAIELEETQPRQQSTGITEA